MDASQSKQHGAHFARWMYQNKERKDADVPDVVVALQVTVARGGRHALFETRTIVVLQNEKREISWFQPVNL